MTPSNAEVSTCMGSIAGHVTIIWCHVYNSPEKCKYILHFVHLLLIRVINSSGIFSHISHYHYCLHSSVDFSFSAVFVDQDGFAAKSEL
jgi:hypothetical protein